MLLTPRAGNEGSAIAVIRLKGPGVTAFLLKHFSREPLAGRSVHGELRDGETLIDDMVLVTGFACAWADLCLHGGAWVIESALKLARREGFEVLDPALPVPDAALDAQDELGREVQAYLALARTPAVVCMLLDQPRAWKEAVAKGFNASALLADQTLWRLLHPPEIAIIGAPNVGKSTLANRLFGRDRSITADVPGTTRDWVGEMADIGGMPAVLIDTPGVRKTTDEIERAAIGASRQRIRGCELLIHVFDATSTNVPLPQHGEAGIAVANKIDLISRPVSGAIAISAKTGEGVDRLIEEIHRVLGIRTIDQPRMRWWTDRQQKYIRSQV
jgi:small GTP-binding protein